MQYVTNMTQLANALGIDQSVLRHHFRKPNAPKKTDKGWDVVEVKRWHTEEIAKSGRLPAYEPPGEGETPEADDTVLRSPQSSLAALKLREAKAKAEERELKVARMRGEMIPKDVAARVGAKFVQDSRTQMLAIVAIAPELAIMTDVVAIETLLRREICAAMDCAARMPYIQSHDNDPK